MYIPCKRCILVLKILQHVHRQFDLNQTLTMHTPCTDHVQTYSVYHVHKFVAKDVHGLYMACNQGVRGKMDSKKLPVYMVCTWCEHGVYMV